MVIFNSLRAAMVKEQVTFGLAVLLSNQVAAAVLAHANCEPMNLGAALRALAALLRDAQHQHLVQARRLLIAATQHCEVALAAVAEEGNLVLHPV